MKLIHSLLLAAVAGVMVACGGGSSPADQDPDALDLVGTVAAASALSGAAVSVKCASGPALAQTITSSDGTFSMSIRSAVLPCMIEASGSGQLYRSLVVGSGADVVTGTYRVNASPLTELLVARIAGTNGSTAEALYAGFATQYTDITPAGLASAMSYLRTALTALIDLAGADPLSDLLVAAHGTTAANAQGAKLGSFMAQLEASGTSLATLSVALASSQTDPTPLRPQVTTHPASLEVVAPGSATYSVQANSILRSSFQWQKSTDGGATYTDLSGATGASYTVASTLMADSGVMYRVRVESVGGTTISSAATLTVTAPAPPPTAPVITSQPQNTSAPYGRSATFSVSATSDSGLSYQWRRNGVEIDGATEASFSIPIVVPGDDGATITVIVINSVGSTSSVAATLRVTGIPAVTPPTVGAAASHSVALRSDGAVMLWGNIKADIGTSLSGLLGIGSSTAQAGVPTAARNSNGSPFNGVQTVAGGQWSTLVLKTDGTVWGWGYCGWGNLGQSGPWTFEQKSPVQVRLADGSPLSGVTRLAAGNYSTSMAVSADGTVWGWGQNRYGHLGIGEASESGQSWAVPMLSPSGLGRFTDAVQAVPGISSVAVLKRDGTIYTVGWAGVGALGDGSTNNRTLPARVETAPGQALSDVVSIAAGGHFYVAVTSDGTAYTWGDNGSGRLGDGTLANRSRPVLVREADGRPMKGIVAATAGMDFSVFLKADGTVWTAGNNSKGQLGANTSTPYSAYAIAVRDSTNQTFGDVVSISSLDSHTVVRRKDGTVWTWGSNEYHQLGDTTTVNRWSPFQVPLPLQ